MLPRPRTPPRDLLTWFGALRRATDHADTRPVCPWILGVLTLDDRRVVIVHTVGSSGMRRKGRRRRPKVSGNPSGELGFSGSAFTPPGQINRARAFARGLRADSSLSRRRFRNAAIALGALLAAMIVVPLLVNSATDLIP